jgi:hypothetical protein
VRAVGLQKSKQEPWIVLKDEQSKLPEDVRDLNGFFLDLFLPDDVMFEFLGKESKVDGTLDEREETGLVDVLILLEVQLNFPAIQFQLTPLEVCLQKLPNQL